MKIQWILSMILLAAFLSMNGYADSTADRTVQAQGSVIDEREGGFDYTSGSENEEDDLDSGEVKDTEASSALSVKGKAIPETAAGL